MDGHELRLVVNYLAPAMLARLLLPSLKNAPDARVINIGSVGQSAVDIDDIEFRRDYNGAEAYFRSKFALAAFTLNGAEDFQKDNVLINCVHPATFMDTRMVREIGTRPWVSVRAGVRPVLRRATDRRLAGVTGKLFNGMHESRANSMIYDPQFRL